MNARRTRFRCPKCGSEILHIDPDVYFCVDEYECGFYTLAVPHAAKVFFARKATT